VGVAGREYRDFDVLSFDCYGTLIDWESGIAAAARFQLGDALAAFSDDQLITAFATVEHEAESPPYKTYREVLALSLRGMGDQLGFAVGDGQAKGFGASAGQWPAFPDSGDALRRLQEQFHLAVITNCDDDLFAQSERRLGIAFDHVVTAQQAGSYKPDPRIFELAFERIGRPRERILHVAQSLFHDHVPAQALGLATVWMDRREGLGGGASLDAEANPDARFTTMAAFADAAAPA
jgi:2-haloacid dehalogenase